MSGGKKKTNKTNQRVDFCKGKYLFTISTIILLDKLDFPADFWERFDKLPVTDLLMTAFPEVFSVSSNQQIP